MNVLSRRVIAALAGAAAAVALAVPLASQAHAVPGAVLLHTNANEATAEFPARYLANVDGSAFMTFGSGTDLRQQWFLQPSGSSKKIVSVSDQTRCLTAGTSNGAFARVRMCDGSTRQLWTLSNGELRSGLRAFVDLANINNAVRMSTSISSPLAANESWHTHSAP